jgi:hypothetical protein
MERYFVDVENGYLTTDYKGRDLAGPNSVSAAAMRLQSGLGTGCAVETIRVSRVTPAPGCPSLVTIRSN